MDPTCALGCADEEAVLPLFIQDECVPAVEFGEISEIFLGIPGNPFVTGDLAEWTARLGATDNTKIIRVLVIGDRPRSTAAAPLVLSGGRKVTVPRDFTVNFSIDDVSVANHEAVRQIQCGGNYTAWYRTSESKNYFGGLSGIPKAFIDADLVIPREKAGIMTYEGTITWNARFMEEMLPFPLA